MTQQNRTGLASDIATKINDNAAGEISAQDVRDLLTDLSDSNLNLFEPNEYTKTQNFNATTLVDGAGISWDLESNQVTSVTLAGNRTLNNPTNMVDGATYILIVKQDGIGGRTLSFGANYKWPSGTAPTLSTGINAIDIITFVSDGTNMYGVFQGDFA
jgi:hypothetical protein